MLEQARKEGFVPCKHCVDKLPKLGMEVLKINGAML
jgi:hypothetical protein